MNRRMFRYPFIVGAALALGLAAWSASLVPPSHAAASAPAASSPPSIVYVAGGHLWLQPLDGGPARTVRTPWPLSTDPNTYQDVQWSPDFRRVALDDQSNRLAVSNLATGHITLLLNQRCRSNDCYAFNYAWSTNGRYLAFLRPYGDGSHGTLSLWDSTRGTTRQLVRGITGLATGIEWSHDSTRMLVSTGPFDIIKSIFPSATVVTRDGRARVLTRGIGYGWSPDDRFIGVVRSHYCGANTCDDAELVEPVAGGTPITLVQHIASTFEYADWAPGFPVGNIVSYGFDRWVLDFNGHIHNRVAGAKERVDSWSPDGTHVAVQTYHPYEETPDALYVSTPGGVRVHLYTAGRKNSCGACSKGTYGVVWSRCGRGLVAFSTPTYPTPKLAVVHSRTYVVHVDGSGEMVVPTPPGADAYPLSFGPDDSSLILQAGSTLYRYAIASRSLQVLAAHVNAVANPPVSAVTCAELLH